MLHCRWADSMVVYTSDLSLHDLITAASSVPLAVCDKTTYQLHYLVRTRVCVYVWCVCVGGGERDGVTRPIRRL